MARRIQWTTPGPSGTPHSLSALASVCLFIARSRLGLASLCGVFCLALGGCYSQPGPPDTVEGRFEPEQVSIDSSGREHVVVAQVPSPGYTLVLDSTWEAYRSKHVFVTLRGPDPRFSYPQATVELRVLTQVSTRESLTVFARRAARAEEDIEDEYRMAAQAAGTTNAANSAPPGSEGE